MRALWRSILLGFGIRKVLEAPDALTALDMVREEPIDVLFVDHILPDLSGAELVRMIRRSDELPNRIPAIACTADARRSTLKELVNAGADEVLAKPVSAVQAWKKLAAVVNKRRPFVQTSIYFGLDRRRSQKPFVGPEKRMGDRLDY